MKRILYVLVACFFFEFMNIDIKASQCSVSDKERLQKLANNVNVTIEEVNDEENISFNIIFTGMSKDLKFDFGNKFEYYYGNEIGEKIIKNVPQGQKYNIELKGAYICRLESFRMLVINTPAYNSYYNHDLCHNNREYSLCQKWDVGNVTYDEFINKINKYITDKQKNKNVMNDNSSNQIDFYDFYMRYYWYVLIGLIFVLTLLIYLWIKENKKNKL